MTNNFPFLFHLKLADLADSADRAATKVFRKLDAVFTGTISLCILYGQYSSIMTTFYYCITADVLFTTGLEIQTLDLFRLPTILTFKCLHVGTTSIRVILCPKIPHLVF
jgi:hypothetical protein